MTFVLITACNEPEPVLASAWCNMQPCYDFFGLTVNQLSSSILVYILGLYGLFVGYKYFKNKESEQSRLYWCISLLLGGLGALSAGTSFQAFGYEIKCAGKELCDLTSSLEIAYNILTVWSVAFLFLAINASFLNTSRLKPIGAFIMLFGGVYSVLCLLAFYQNNYFLVSFEFLLLSIAPIYLYIFILTGVQHAKRKNLKTRHYLIAWLILMLTLIAYYFYLILGYTEILWTKGIWFSANDVLHIGMMGWLFYLSNYMMEGVKDHKSGT